MPVYEYECQACKYYTEVMQKITDAPLIKCPSCGKRRLKRLVSAPAFRLKGGGWYETDFKSDKEAKRNLLAAEKEEAKAESKPEAKETAAAGKVEAPAKESPPGKESREPGAAAAAKPPSPKAESREGAGASGGAASESGARRRRRAFTARSSAPHRSARGRRGKPRRGRR
jgi:putative FmdB family regulatory protein